MKRDLMLVIIFFGSLSVLRAENKTPFSITATVNEAARYRPKDREIELKAKVKNVSSQTETFVVTGGCRWIFWTTDNSSVRIMGHDDCLSNLPEPITLKPSEEYSERLYVHIPTQIDRVDFRVGFTPNKLGADLLKSNESYPTMWSNVVKASVPR
jgi:hypothetical protein